MKKEDLNSSKVPIIVLDKKLEKFRGKVLFPKKLERANQILATAGLPVTAPWIPTFADITQLVSDRANGPHCNPDEGTAPFERPSAVLLPGHPAEAAAQ